MTRQFIREFLRLFLISMCMAGMGTTILAVVALTAMTFKIFVWQGIRFTLLWSIGAEIVALVAMAALNLLERRGERRDA